MPLARASIGPGQRVHSVGNPGRSGGLWLYTSGMVRQVYRKEWSVRSGDRKFDFRARVVETSSPTNAGDSGGPLVNDRGELVAITQGGAADAQLLSFFIDVSEVKTFLAQHNIQGKPGVVVTERSRDPVQPAPGRVTTDPGDKQEQLAAAKLKYAHVLAADGKTDRAREYCEVILKTYASTEAAKEARLLLDKLKK
jgi:S1-C subfamily serine protease